MSNIATIPQFNLPAALAEQFAQFATEDDLSQGVSGGFPVMSIRGAKWRMVEGGEETPITMPGTKDLTPFVKVILLVANKNLSKTFYIGSYVEGSDAKPDCYSNHGIVPAADSPAIQAPTCATCPQNVWGSKVNASSGAKVKACADVRRVALLPADDLDYSPILLRIPGASLSDLANYGKALKARGIPYAAVVTKLSFDSDAAYPKINFQFDRVLTQEEMTKVVERMQDPVVQDVLGQPESLTPAIPAPAAPAKPAVDEFGIPANVAPPAPAAKPDAELEAAVGQIEKAAAKPKARAKAGAGFGGGAAETPAEKPAAPAPAPAGAMMDDIDSALAGLGLD